MFRVSHHVLYGLTKEAFPFREPALKRSNSPALHSSSSQDQVREGSSTTLGSACSCVPHLRLSYYPSNGEPFITLRMSSTIRWTSACTVARASYWLRVRCCEELGCKEHTDTLSLQIVRRATETSSEFDPSTCEKPHLCRSSTIGFRRDNFPLCLRTATCSLLTFFVLWLSSASVAWSSLVMTNLITFGSTALESDQIIT